MKNKEKYAKEIVPVDTGRLRNSITHAVEGKEVFVGSATEYAASVEYGTVKQPAQSYARPTADAEQSHVIDDVRDELAIQIGKAKARIAKRALKGR